MSPLIIALPWAAFCLPLAQAAHTVAAAPEVALFADAGRVLPAGNAFAAACREQLADFHARTGVDLRVELEAGFKPATPAQRPGSFAGARAAQLRLGDRAILAVYFADRDQWGLWLGEGLLARLVGRLGDAQTFTHDGSLHRAKQALIAAARARGDAGSPAEADDHIPSQVRAMMAVLMEKFADRAGKPLAADGGAETPRVHNQAP